MTWEEFYENCSSWHDRTTTQYISTLTDFGPAPEIVDVANSLSNQRAAARLVRRAIGAGVQFSASDLLALDGTMPAEDYEAIAHLSLENGTVIEPEDILQFDGLVSTATLEAIVLKAVARGVLFTFHQIMDLEGLVSTPVLSRVVQAELERGVSYSPYQIMSLSGVLDKKTLSTVASKSRAVFSENDLFILEGIVSDDVIVAIRRRQGQQQGPAKSGLEALAALTMMTEDGAKPPAKRVFHVGDYVRIRYRDQYGTVIDVNGGLYMVRFAGRVDSFSADQLEKG